MTMNPRDKDFQAKKEDEDLNYTKFPKITSSSRQWSSYKNPRIVRVSRTFGGKDRHSKVCTVRGLRDRRIRLSVPTAIQLYDLQDRLGFSQPSKVVDWLIDATKHEIDKLPPLPMLPGNFTQFHQPNIVPNSHESLASNPQSSLPHFLTPDHLGKMNDERETAVQENQEGFGGFVAQLSAQNYLFPLNNQSCFPYFHWDPSNISLSQFGGLGYHPFSIQTEDHNSHIIPTVLPSSSQLYFCPSATAIPSMPLHITPSMDNDLRQINHLQHVQKNPVLPTTTLHLISSPMKSKVVLSQGNETGRTDKDKSRNS